MMHACPVVLPRLAQRLSRPRWWNKGLHSHSHLHSHMPTKKTSHSRTGRTPKRTARGHVGVLHASGFARSYACRGACAPVLIGIGPTEEDSTQSRHKYHQAPTVSKPGKDRDTHTHTDRCTGMHTYRDPCVGGSVGCCMGLGLVPC